MLTEPITVGLPPYRRRGNPLAHPREGTAAPGSTLCAGLPPQPLEHVSGMASVKHTSCCISLPALAGWPRSQRHTPPGRRTTALQRRRRGQPTRALVHIRRSPGLGSPWPVGKDASSAPHEVERAPLVQCQRSFAQGTRIVLGRTAYVSRWVLSMPTSAMF